MRHGLLLASFLALLLTAGCANVNYATVKEGSFDGELAVVWLKGTKGPGDGTFVYVPTPGNPLTFTRPDGTTITPTMIYTDGGSVPSIGRVFSGLTPWNYAPAYIVHDWLFRAKQCLTENSTDPAYDVVKDMTFAQSAQIIAESIKALEVSGRVRKNDVSASLVTTGVSSPLSLALWQKKDACQEVTDADRALALGAVGRTPEIGDDFSLRLKRAGEVVDLPAVVVSVTSFD
jgi:hypothetical protein